MILKLGSKAENLIQLETRIRSAKIAPLYRFNYHEWTIAQEDCVKQALELVGDRDAIVRSSADGEDALGNSQAGKFLSVLNVCPSDLAEAVEQVFQSYDDVNEHHEVFIQPMLENVIRSGVALTHDPNTQSPYRVVSWTDGGDTTLVTGGKGGKTWTIAATASKEELPEWLRGILSLLDELRGLFGDIPLDCEYAITQSDNNNILWLLQVRGLHLSSRPEMDTDQKTKLEYVHAKVSRGLGSHPFLLGKRSAYGVMPDWNPAEIIGIRPKPLALSLYRELITDSIWAYQRHNYGYRNLRSFPLMVHFFGLPYIDVRVSFNSFVPASLDSSLASRLVDYYVERFLNEPTLHDKVEFEVVFSCYTLDLQRRLRDLSPHGFSRADQGSIAEALRGLTNRILSPEDGLWRKDAARIQVLRQRHEQLSLSEADPVERIYWLLEDTKRYGTLPFAGLARAGFVAVQLLKSLVAEGILSDTDYDAFFTSLSTISRKITLDLNELDKTTFLSQYGHLRPGTYDITSPRYDETPDSYFDWSKKPADVPHSAPFSITLNQMRTVGQSLKTHGLEIDPVGLFDFIQTSIEQREYAKFLFTRNLSDALVLISDYGSTFGFSKSDLAYCDIAVFKELLVTALDPQDAIARRIDHGKALYEQTQSLCLPPVITKPDDIWAFEWPAIAPNFLTRKRVTAPVVGHQCPIEKLHGSIVCIPNADPGFDWLFSHPIAGLVTAWGGANSHMAIRAGEMGLPSVIGAGELLFDEWSKARRLHIDCATQRVEVIA